MGHHTDWKNTKYFRTLIKKLRANTLFEEMETNNPLSEIGITVVERADFMVRSEIDDRRSLSRKKAALEAFEQAVIRHPEFVEEHFLRSLGVFRYDGLLSQDIDVRRSWEFLRPHIENYAGLQKLSSTICA